MGYFFNSTEVVSVFYKILTCRNTERIKVCRQKEKNERYAQQAVQNLLFMLVFTNVKIKVEKIKDSNLKNIISEKIS